MFKLIILCAIIVVIIGAPYPESRIEETKNGLFAKYGIAGNKNEVGERDEVEHATDGPDDEGDCDDKDDDTDVEERKGYFWHITDLHYDAHFSTHGDTRKNCWRTDGNSRTPRRPASRYGDYACDAPWELIESAARTMMSRQGDNVEFVLWTGDALSHNSKRMLSKDQQQVLLQNLTDLFQKTFSSQFVFPALGHDDPNDRYELANMWRRWLPTDSTTTFESGGFYLIEHKTLRLQIVVLNTNLMHRSDNDDEACKQWDWLSAVLHKCQQSRETVYLVGHMPPGSDERQRGGNVGISVAAHSTYSNHHNLRYLRIVRKYADIIMGQFFGHLHSDSFRVIYNDHGHPTSWAMIAPGIAPRRTSDGANNPGLRLYKFDKDTGQVLDYTQYYLDLPSIKTEPEWQVEYNFSSYYNIHNITPFSLHNLAEKMTQSSPLENHAFKRYYRANAVQLYTNGLRSCDVACAHAHYCAITRVDYAEHEQCLKTAASALASSSASRSAKAFSTVSPLALAVMLFICAKI